MYDASTWRFEKDGEYIVRSSYHQIMNDNNDAIKHRVARHSNLLWNLKLPLKVKNFI